jgi:C1A family cysteine protease
MNSILSLLGSALLLGKAPMMSENNNDFVFCLMKNKVSSSQTIDLNNQCSHFVGDLHRNCMDYMNSPFIENDCSNQFDLSTEVSSKWSKFIDYMVDYRKVYHSNDELNSRYNIFHDNLEYIAEHNRDASHTYTVGINRFADMSHNEYKEFVKSGGLVVPKESNNLRLPKDMCGTAKSESGSYPKSVDWREKGAVTPVRDQGLVGSCYAHSASEALESAYFIKKGVLPNLSVQQIVDCSYSYGNHGNNGGMYTYSWTYIHDSGLTTESAYPYTAGQSDRSSCQPFTPYTYVSDCKHVPSNELQLTYAVSHQPVSVAIEADSRSFQLYTGGVYNNPDCGTNIDHAVVVVGYGSMDGQDYWTTRNSWGESYGLDGYILIARNSVETSTVGQCAIATYAAYPIV